MKKYYIYFHKKKSDGEIFYIGKWCGKRAWASTSRNKYWRHIVDKHGLEVQIASDDLTEEHALAMEVYFIAMFREIGYNLANMTDGGEGTSGYIPVFTDDHRRKISEAGTGKVRSYEARRKMSEAAKLRTVSQEKRKKTSESLRLSRPNANKPVIDSDGTTYACAAEAAQVLRSNGKPKAVSSAIHAVCQGRKLSAYGRHWQYA